MIGWRERGKGSFFVRTLHLGAYLGKGGGGGAGVSGPFFIVLDPDEEKNLDETSNQPTLHKTAGMRNNQKKKGLRAKKRNFPLLWGKAGSFASNFVGIYVLLYPRGQ